MKCLVFSDSHGSRASMRRVIAMHPDAEVIFFLGDGLSDAESVAYGDIGRAWIAVKGNCDGSAVFMSSTVLAVDSITLLGHKIVLTHGHYYGAKAGLDGLISLAEREGADVVLFGHTHIPCEKYLSDFENPIRLYNPGSIAFDYESFGVLDIFEGKEPVFSVGTLRQKLN